MAVTVGEGKSKPEREIVNLFWKSIPLRLYNGFYQSFEKACEKKIYPLMVFSSRPNKSSSFSKRFIVNGENDTWLF